MGFSFRSSKVGAPESFCFRGSKKNSKSVELLSKYLSKYFDEYRNLIQGIGL